MVTRATLNATFSPSLKINSQVVELEAQEEAAQQKLARDLEQAHKANEHGKEMVAMEEAKKARSKQADKHFHEHEKQKEKEDKQEKKEKVKEGKRRHKQGGKGGGSSKSDDHDSDSDSAAVSPSSSGMSQNLEVEL